MTAIDEDDCLRVGDNVVSVEDAHGLDGVRGSHLKVRISTIEVFEGLRESQR